jgi:hypothetical protein
LKLGGLSPRPNPLFGIVGREYGGLYGIFTLQIKPLPFGRLKRLLFQIELYLERRFGDACWADT